MRKSLIPLLIVLGLLGATSAVVLAVGASGDEGAPVTSDEGIAPDECSLVHNIEACDEGGQPPIRSDEGIAPDECSLVHNIEACDEGGQPPIRSDEGIDPDECNLVHNIDACSPEELEDAGLATPGEGGQAPITSH